MECQIIPEKCIACGLCQVYAPDIFDYTEEGIVLFKNDPHALIVTVNSQDDDAVTTAYRKCPVRAIEIVKNDQTDS
ncbi:ferredoxin [Enterococcus sp. BWM-S5]|uniref:Ferredoxin n=1 Tax=Enterococcus larvae TaxID=2794352 RepID=A0ABS4CGF3_9ENTE|nr:ferredoxin [Enterococcus larvae]MBP1045636.1 ferredoxin [Enterococcus larvae]